MYQAWIAVVDASHARWFQFERSEDETGVHEQMTERGHLANHHHHDSRDHHRDRADATFARSALEHFRDACRDSGVARVVLCAGPRMLGHLRTAAAEILPASLDVVEVAHELATLTPAQIRTHLAHDHVLPAHQS